MARDVTAHMREIAALATLLPTVEGRAPIILVGHRIVRVMQAQAP